MDVRAFAQATITIKHTGEDEDVRVVAHHADIGDYISDERHAEFLGYHDVGGVQVWHRRERHHGDKGQAHASRIRVKWALPSDR